MSSFLWAHTLVLAILEEGTAAADGSLIIERERQSGQQDAQRDAQYDYVAFFHNEAGMPQVVSEEQPTSQAFVRDIRRQKAQEAQGHL